MSIARNDNGTWNNSVTPDVEYPSRSAARSATADPTPEPTPTPEPSTETVDPGEVVGETQSAAAKRAARATAALRGDKVASESIAKGEKVTGTKSSPVTRHVPGAVRRSGSVSLPVKSDTHREVLSAVVGKVPGVEFVEATMLVDRSTAPAVLAAIRDGLARAKGNEFHSRLLTISYVTLRHALPRLVDDLGGVGALVTDLHTAVAAGTLSAWDVAFVADSTLRYTLTNARAKVVAEGVRARVARQILDGLVEKVAA